MITRFGRGLLIVVAAALLLGAVAAAYTARANSNLNSSNADLVVTGRPQSSPQDNAYSTSQYVNQRMQTYAAVASSDEVLTPAAESLSIDPSKLAGAARASVPPGTSLLTVTVKGSSPQQAQERAQAVVAALTSAILRLESTAAPTLLPGGATASEQRVSVAVLSQPSLPAKSSLPPVPVAATLGAAVGLLVGLALVLGLFLRRRWLHVRIHTRSPSDASGNRPDSTNASNSAQLSQTEAESGIPDGGAGRRWTAESVQGEFKAR